MSGLEVLRAGALTTIQDLGRPGLAHLGVPHSGAADVPALLAANALVGNAPGAAALETTLTGPSLRFGVPALVAVTGAPAPVKLDGRAAPFGAALAVPAGAVLDVGAATSGVRSYLAIAGGIAAEPALGSRSHDTLTGLGPSPLARGDVLEIGDADAGPSTEGPATEGQPGASDRPGTDERRDAAGGERNEVTVLNVLPGPRDDLFAADALAALQDEPFTVSPTSNRIGVRLAGASLERRAGGELPSEGLVRGAIQVPGSGAPIVMLADHPTTGGYPVIAVVAEADHGLIGQLRPGTAVRFRAV